MKKYYSSLLLAALFIVCPNILFSANKQEWYGQWNMNHDGFNGVLTVSDSKVDCASSAWCDMVISYTDKNGRKVTGTIGRIDDNWQHMQFYLNFPGNRQKFDAYIFSWDKQSMAGTTYWGGRTFGFFATKGKNIGHAGVKFPPKNLGAAAQPASVATGNSLTTGAGSDDPVISKKILTNDTIEIRYASGTIKWKTSGGITTKHPDGTITRALFVQTPAYVPPTAISDQRVTDWLTMIKTTLLDMIKEELLNDQVSISNLTSRETSQNMNMYQVINNRFYFLNYFNNYK